ncbi:MAG: hypothetical protein H0T73_23285 [Ardenticatenales bacterium]|nr:hypothetical protein [Ardenticatenales bacterium]
MGLDDTLRELKNKIPGFSLESRREADKELRTATAAAFTSQVSRLTRVQEQALKEGDFDILETLDRIITRLQHLGDRIRTASYGYTGLFDDDKVDEGVLDSFYAFDLEIANGVEQVADLIAQLGNREQRSEILDLLRAKIDGLHDAFGNRSQLIDTYKGPGRNDPTETI